MIRVQRTLVISLALVCLLMFASIAFAAKAPKLTAVASFTYPQANSGTAYICVKVTGPPKTVLHVAVSGASVLGVKAKNAKIGAKRVAIVKFQTNTPAGYILMVTGKLGKSPKTTKRTTVNVPQPQQDAAQGAFSCI